MCVWQAMVVRAAACASLPHSQRAAPGSSVSNVPLARPALKAPRAKTTATACLVRAPTARPARAASGRTQAPASAALTARREIWASPALQTAVSVARLQHAMQPEVSTTASGSTLHVFHVMLYLMCGHSTANTSEQDRHAHMARVDPPCGRILCCCCCWVNIHTDCPPGAYGSDCLPCTPGSWCPGGKQAPITACGPNRFSAAAAKSAGDCYCVPGAIRAGIGCMGGWLGVNCVMSTHGVCLRFFAWRVG